MTTRELMDLVRTHGGRLIIYEPPAELEDAARAVDEAPPPPSSLVDIAEEEGEALKLKEWSARLNLSCRELGRAVAAGAVRHDEKGTGRDAQAVVIHGADMADYLRTCEAVQGGHIQPPKWWFDVRKGANAQVVHNVAA